MTSNRSRETSSPPDSPLASVRSSQVDEQSSPIDIPAVNVLTEEGEELRSKLKVHLESGLFDKESIIKIAKPYGEAVVQAVLPTFLGGLIEKKTRQQLTADKIKTAVLALEREHKFHFKWNKIYEDFLRGRPSETTNSEKGVQYIRSVLGDDYKTFINLPQGKDSNVRVLRPICKLMGLLAMSKEDLRAYILKVQAQRCVTKAGTQGHRQTVTMEDLETVKDALTKLKWSPPPAAPKRPREFEGGEKPDKRHKGAELPIPQKDSGKDGKKGNPGQGDEEDGADKEDNDDDRVEGRNNEERTDEVSNSRYLSPSQDVTRLQLPPPPMRRVYTPERREKTPPVEFPRVSAGARERTTRAVPKSGKDLWLYRVLGAGPLSGSIRFGDWMDSDYVHGHGGGGEFALDDVVTGSITVPRLIGFHDSFKRHFGRDYLNSWIVLPRCNLSALNSKWIALSELLNHRVLARDDGSLRRIQRGSQGVLDALTEGCIPLVMNALGYPAHLYPDACNAIEDYIPSATTIISKKGTESSLIDKIRESEDSQHVLSRFPDEIWLEAPFPVPACVTNRLGKAYFLGQKFGVNLRYPHADHPGMQESLRTIGNTMPRFYGDPSSGALSRFQVEVGTRANMAGVYFGGDWTQPLKWKGNDPSMMIKGGIYERRQPVQVEWLKREVMEHLGVRRCVALCGSQRNRTTSIAGSIFWSLLYRGERLILLYGPNGSYKNAIAVIQHPGDLVIIPPGHEYAWYSIRSCISDEGSCYRIKNFNGHHYGDLYIPGTFDALTRWSMGNPTPNHKSSSIIVYSFLVSMFTDWTLTYGGEAFGLVAQSIVKLLCLPVFSYLPRVSTPLSPLDLADCTKVLAWTAPYAAVVLDRCVKTSASNDNRPTPLKDSMTLKDAEDAIVTDTEDEWNDSQTNSPMIPTHVSSTHMADPSIQNQGETNTQTEAMPRTPAHSPAESTPKTSSAASRAESISNEDIPAQEVAAAKLNGGMSDAECTVEGVGALAEEGATRRLESDAGPTGVAVTENIAIMAEIQGPAFGSDDLRAMAQFSMDAVTAEDISD